MNIPKLYLRLCFALTIIECARQLYSSGSMLFQGIHVMMSVTFIVLFGLMAISAIRMIRNHHIPSVNALITLRIGMIIAMGTYLLLLKPTPPIAVIGVRLSLHFLQLFVALQAKRGLLKEAAT